MTILGLQSRIRRGLRQSFGIAARAVFVVVFMPLLWLLEPFWRVRIGAMVEDRIGHLAANTFVFYKRVALDGWSSRTSYLFFGWSPANRTLFDMWKRILPIVETHLGKHFYIAIEPILKRTRFHQTMPFDNTEHREFAMGEPPPLTFTPQQEEQGRQLLAKMGIGENDWFVCFHSREPAYLHERRGFGQSAPFRPAIRDCTIDNYLAAAREISRRGGYAIRMGAVVDKPLPDLGDARIVDYATRHRTDFGDIFLSAKCHFFLGCTAGLVCVPWLFHRPVAAANFVSLQFAALGGPRTLFIPKLIRRKADGKVLSFLELHRMGFFDVTDYGVTKRQEFYDAQGLEWVENSAEEILDLTLDMFDKLEGRASPLNALQLQDAYHRFYRPGPHYTEHSGRIAPRFVVRHAGLIAGDTQVALAG